MFFLPITYFKNIFYVKILQFCDFKVWPESGSAWIRIGLASWIWIRIRIEIKSCIRIRAKTSADPQHWSLRRIRIKTMRSTRSRSYSVFLFTFRSTKCNVSQIKSPAPTVYNMVEAGQGTSPRDILAMNTRYSATSYYKWSMFLIKIFV